MASLINITKTATTTLANITKASAEAIFLVSESLDFYLIGATESDFLVTKDVSGTLTNVAKN